MSTASLIDDTDGSGIAAPSFADILVLARADFWVFVELMFPVLHPGQALAVAPYLEVMATLLMSVADGRRRRVIFNLPPRHMKSMLVSVLYPAWRLGRDPSAKFICISYGDDLAHDLSASVRKLMLSDLYRRIFPKTVLDKKAVDHITTTRGGRRYATAVGSDITGFGADEIIIDDPMQPDEAASELVKERVRSWVHSSVLTRFNDPSRGVLMLVMHRLAPDDLSATLEATGAYLTLKLPLIARSREKFCDSRNGRVLMDRKPGEVLNPERMDQAQVEELEASLPSHVFASQYQQSPMAGGSGMLSIEHFRRYKRAHPPAFEFLVHSWDIGATVGGNASVCTKWGVVREPGRRDVVYLIEVVRLKVELPDVREAIKAHDRIDRPALIILDERGAGLGVYQDLSKAGYAHVTGLTRASEPLARAGAEVRPNLGKVELFGRATLAIADGRVLIPDEAPWLEAFLYEVAAFPNISDKDQVDAMSQFLAYLERALLLARQGCRPSHL